MVFLYSGTDMELLQLLPQDTRISVSGPLSIFNQHYFIEKLLLQESTKRLVMRDIHWRPFPLRFLPWLQNLQFLNRLEITDSPNFGIEIIDQLCACIATLKLTYLDVSGLDMGMVGGRQLANSIRLCPTLQTVLAHRNKFQSSCGKLMATHVKTLGLGDNDVHPLWWCRFLDQSNCLRKNLLIPESRLNDHGFYALGKYLNLHQLVVLDISENRLSLPRLQNLCVGLNTHLTLTVLHLQQCGLDDILMSYFCDILDFNQSLQYIHLENNPNLTILSQQRLIECLQINYTLLYIDIDILFHEIEPSFCTSRITIQHQETFLGHIIRLLNTNQDLALSCSFWSRKLHSYYPNSVNQKVYMLILLLRPLIPMDIILYIFSFWYGIHPR